MTVLDEAGEPQYLIKTHEDVTDRRQTESRMAHMAYHDGLTDLPNRASFLQALAQMIEACAGTDEEFAVLCVDLDGLKEINDVFGHAMGDKLLIEVAGRIQASARGGVVARLSGDEFGLIIDGKQPEAARRWPNCSRKRCRWLPDRRQVGGPPASPPHLGISASRRGAASVFSPIPAPAFSRQAEVARLYRHFRARDGPADPRPPRSASGPLDGDQERRLSLH